MIKRAAQNRTHQKIDDGGTGETAENFRSIDGLRGYGLRLFWVP